MRPTETQLRSTMASVAKRTWERGWVANHDGNASQRLTRGRILCTPTGESKQVLDTAMLIIVDEANKVVSGKLRPFSELALHRAWYAARADVQAVLHAHPPAATAFGAAGRELPHPFLPEAVVSLGPSIPTVPLSPPGAAAVAEIAPYLFDHDALVVAGNGVLTCGDDLEQAYLRMELVEHIARIAAQAELLGGVQQLPAHLLEPLLDARKRAGLGPEARPAAAAAAPSDERPTRRFGRPAAEEKAEEPDLERAVADDIARVLR